jgi:hypothetical protein
MDQVADKSLEIVLVVEMRGDTQTQILADPNEIAGGENGSEGIGGPTAKWRSSNACWSVFRGI